MAYRSSWLTAALLQHILEAQKTGITETHTLDHYVSIARPAAVSPRTLSLPFRH